MSSYCLKCRKNTESINLRVSRTNNGKTLNDIKGGSFSKKTSKIRTFAVMIRIIITFANQTFL